MFIILLSISEPLNFEIIVYDSNSLYNDSPWLLKGSNGAIPSNSNFNNYTAPGVYYVETDGIAPTISNIPINIAGRLIVSASTTPSQAGVYVFQMYFSYNVSIHYRSRVSNGTWSEWRQIMNLRNYTNNSLNQIMGTYSNGQSVSGYSGSTVFHFNVYGPNNVRGGLGFVVDGNAAVKGKWCKYDNGGNWVLF